MERPEPRVRLCQIERGGGKLVAEGDVRAVAPLMKVLDWLDRRKRTCPAGWPRVAAGAGVVTVMALVLAGGCRPVSLPMRCWWPDGAPLVRPSTCLDVAPTWPRRDDCGG